MPRFVVLTHDHPFFHWDLLLEQGDGCRTWRLERSPDDFQTTPAEELPIHRLLYLDYEGPVSGNRGTVARWDFGTFEWLHTDLTCVRVQLNGARLSGAFSLVTTHNGWVWTRDPEQPRASG